MQLVCNLRNAGLIEPNPGDGFKSQPVTYRDPWPEFYRPTASGHRPSQYQLRVRKCDPPRATSK